MSKGYSESTAIRYYSIWRRHYLESSREDLMLSGIYLEVGREKKALRRMFIYGSSKVS